MMIVENHIHYYLTEKHLIKFNAMKTALHFLQVNEVDNYSGEERIIKAMEEYAKERAKDLVQALEDIKNWDDDLEDEWEDAGYRAIAALKKHNEKL